MKIHPENGPKLKAVLEAAKLRSLIVPDNPVLVEGVKSPKILDIGCGPGVQTIELLQLCAGNVTALDLPPEMISRLEGAVQAAGFTDRVEVIQADMNKMAFKSESFDLIWSEGSIYLMGFRNGLAKIRPLLKPGGSVAISETVWLKPDPPRELVEFWDGYPVIDTVENKLKVISELEYALFDYFILTQTAWTETYYNPLEEKIAKCRIKWSGNIALLSDLWGHRFEP